MSRTPVTSGGAPAVRAVLRLARRSMRREWRQQTIVFSLLVVAVTAATLFGAVLYNTTGVRELARFGSATYRYTVVDASPAAVLEVAAQTEDELRPVDVVGRWTAPLPGSVETVDYVAQDTAGPHAGPMLALVEGRYPANADEVGITDGLAEVLDVGVGDPVVLDGERRTVVGVVENPSDLQRDFLLAAPGELRHATSIDLLFGGDPDDFRAVQHNTRDLPGGELSSLGDTGSDQAVIGVLGGAQFVLVLVCLVASAGFAALAQRRLRQLGLLSAIGASDRHVTLLLASHGTFVGVTAALLGGGLGVGAWLAISEALEEPVGYRIDPWHLPWWMISLLIAATIVSTTIAAWLPARTATRVATLDALRGAMHAPSPATRSATRSAALTGVGVGLLLLGRERSGTFVALGTLASIVGLLTATPAIIEVVGRLGRRLPIAGRLAVRDLARHRSRSAVALAAVALTLGVPAGVAIMSASADAASTFPNLPPDQVLIWTKHPADPDGVSPFYTADPNDEGFAPFVPPIPSDALDGMATAVETAAADLEAQTVPLPVVVDPGSDPSDGIPIVTVARKIDGGYLDVGLVFAASPALLALHDVEPAEPMLSTLPAAPAEVDADGSTLWLSNTSEPPQVVNQVQRLGTTYTSLPTTLLTTDEVGSRGWTTLDVGWLLTRSVPFTPDEVSALRDLASREGLVVEAAEERRDVTSLRLGALSIGVAVALAVLAMTTGLIRVEAGQTRRVLTAVGASSGLSRSVTAATGGSIALSGAVLGITASYVILAAGFVDDRGTLASVPTVELAVILLGFPVVAALGAWLAPNRTDDALARPMLD